MTNIILCLTKSISKTINATGNHKYIKYRYMIYFAYSHLNITHIFITFVCTLVWFSYNSSWRVHWQVWTYGNVIRPLFSHIRYRYYEDYFANLLCNDIKKEMFINQWKGKLIKGSFMKMHLTLSTKPCHEYSGVRKFNLQVFFANTFIEVQGEMTITVTSQ